MVMVPDQRRCEKEYWLGLSLEVGKNGEKMRRKDTQISGERRKRESRGLSSVWFVHSLSTAHHHQNNCNT